ncbi:hypothetical protein [Pedobacter cryoconitis]|uniref:Uncharacterized protein n=1 Tax=Pedobacter cryoconitis TaxID=188932 RepID=A0A327T5Z8_9SPHI|nr:hypothetical protein [Pedobacter cryoconitis]RAJ35504.1 hypothetical protein LY11_00748 [Pedobacter cryoconitis]
MKQSVARNGKKDFSSVPDLFITQEHMLSSGLHPFGEQALKSGITYYSQLFEKAI